MADAESFRKLNLSRWRQFELLDLDFDSHLCVLTGPNGCGKTTVLNVLGRHFGWNMNFLSASSIFDDDDDEDDRDTDRRDDKEPAKATKSKKPRYADAWKPLKEAAPTDVVGSIEYSSGAIAKLVVPAQGQSQYSLQYQNQLAVVGLHIPSHRPPPSYHQISQIPVNPITSQQHYQEFQNLLFSAFGDGSHGNPAAAMKKALVAFAVLGEGNASVQPNKEYLNIFRGFQEILKKLFPPGIGFESIHVRVPEVILKTKSGDFPLEAMSGGLNALCGMAWQIHMYGFDKEACTVLIDEPENHLHPSMQREFLPRLSRAFPKYKFIVASHSPFIVASEPNAAVYALTYNEEQRVVSRRLEEADLAGSPNKVLREILDVPVTMPIWVEDGIDAVLSKFSGKAIDATVIKEIREALDERGLGNALGDFLVQRKESNGTDEEQPK